MITNPVDQTSVVDMAKTVEEVGLMLRIGLSLEESREKLINQDG